MEGAESIPKILAEDLHSRLLLLANLLRISDKRIFVDVNVIELSWSRVAIPHTSACPLSKSDMRNAKIETRLPSQRAYSAATDSKEYSNPIFLAGIRFRCGSVVGIYQKTR